MDHRFQSPCEVEGHGFQTSSDRGVIHSRPIPYRLLVTAPTPHWWLMLSSLPVAQLKFKISLAILKGRKNNFLSYFPNTTVSQSTMVGSTRNGLISSKHLSISLPPAVTSWTSWGMLYWNIWHKYLFFVQGTVVLCYYIHGNLEDEKVSICFEQKPGLDYAANHQIQLTSKTIGPLFELKLGLDYVYTTGQARICRVKI